MNLSGNTILITGGSSGIGLEMAKNFLKRKNKIIITGRNEQKLQKAKELLGEVTAIQSDVSNSSDVEKMVAAFFKGLSIDKYEIRPGQSNQLKFMSRFFPNFILKQMSKTVDAMHAG